MENTYLSVAACFLGSILLIGFLIVFAGVRVVRADRRLSVYRLGQYIGDKGPGIVFLIPFIERGVLKEFSTLEKSPSKDLDS